MQRAQAINEDGGRAVRSCCTHILAVSHKLLHNVRQYHYTTTYAALAVVYHETVEICIVDVGRLDDAVFLEHDPKLFAYWDRTVRRWNSCSCLWANFACGCGESVVVWIPPIVMSDVGLGVGLFRRCINACTGSGKHRV